MLLVKNLANGVTLTFRVNWEQVALSTALKFREVSPKPLRYVPLPVPGAPYDWTFLFLFINLLTQGR